MIQRISEKMNCSLSSYASRFRSTKSVLLYKPTMRAFSEDPVKRHKTTTTITTKKNINSEVYSAWLDAPTTEEQQNSKAHKTILNASKLRV